MFMKNLYIILLLFLLFHLFQKPVIERIDECRWSQWGPWTKCSEKCGSGKQFRAKANNGQCGKWPNNRQEEARICNSHRCAQGKAGPKGGKGPIGEQGPRGHMGETGKSGGARGAAGGIGIGGGKGEYGDYGDRGEKGKAGERGNEGYVVNSGKDWWKFNLARIYKKIRALNPQSSNHEEIQKVINEDIEKMSSMKAYNSQKYV